MSYRRPPVLLTPPRRAALNFVAAHTERHSFAPTLAEIARHLSLSFTGAQSRVDALISLRMLRRRKHQKRGLSITAAGRAALPARKCPHCGGAM
jgi:DNA-binding MarR family transcriptional regulator